MKKLLVVLAIAACALVASADVAVPDPAKEDKPSVSRTYFWMIPPGVVIVLALALRRRRRRVS